MKITYGNITLNTGFRDAPDNLTLSMDWVVQVAPLLRSPVARLFPRDNESNRIGFTLRQGYSDARDAHARIVTLGATLPRQADLVLKPYGPGGGVSIITVANACLVKFGSQVVGALAVMRFEFVGETIT